MMNNDLISRQAAIDAVMITPQKWDGMYIQDLNCRLRDTLNALPSAQPEKETAKRVLWTGWKGTRNTRYKCPNCKKPVKNDDVYCHRCGQKLMFPHISHSDYIPRGEARDNSEVG